MIQKLLLLALVLTISTSCGTVSKTSLSSKNDVENLLNQWHKDVANFDFDAYFNKLTDDAVFIGTDAGEVWNKQQFMDFSKPYFDKKQTWNFNPLQRNIYFDRNKKIAWFDELLDTWMGLCRGSGVVINTRDGWKIQHYVLSVTVPNDDIDEVVKIKKENELKILGITPNK
jgi:hypothetical protein